MNNDYSTSPSQNLKIAFANILEIANLSCKSMQLQSYIVDLIKSDAPDSRKMIEEYQQEICILNNKIIALKWDDMVTIHVPLSDIKEDGQEFEVMKKAAENGIASAQYSLGMWYDTVAGNKEEAEKWCNNAKENGYRSSVIAEESQNPD
jgi:TPR repeat protein